MKSVKIKTTELLAKVKDNRRLHRADYRKVYAAWRAESINTLQELHSKMRKDEKFVPPIAPLDSAPTNHEDEYTRVITMLDMSVDEVTELSSNEFDMYVMDNWGWKGGFLAASTKYLG